MVIGGIVATTKMTRYFQGTPDALFFFVFTRCWYLLYQFYPTVAWKRTQRKYVESIFALNVQCANKCIEIDEHLSVAKLFNVMGEPLTVPAFSPNWSSLEFSPQYHFLSIYLSTFWNLMHTKWTTASISRSLLLYLHFFYLFLGLSLPVLTFFVCSDFNFNPKLNWMWKIDAKIREKRCTKCWSVCKWM